MILTGRNIRAKKALQMGLVDEMVHPAILRDVAVERARELADGTLEPSRAGARAAPPACCSRTIRSAAPSCSGRRARA